jgi:hypothetical protein
MERRKKKKKSKMRARFARSYPAAGLVEDVLAALENLPLRLVCTEHLMVFLQSGG